MSLEKIRFEIKPKEIDNNDLEEDLGQYSSESNVTDSTKYSATLPNAQKEITLPVIANQLHIEFISSQDVTFKIYDVTGVTELIEFEQCRNLILRASLNHAYKIINNSGQDTTVTWRLYA